jgi:hypothetical protein
MAALPGASARVRVALSLHAEAAVARIGPWWFCVVNTSHGHE